MSGNLLDKTDKSRQTIRSGTAEPATAGRDNAAPAGRDVAPDRVIGGEIPSVPDGLDRIAIESEDETDSEPRQRDTSRR